MKNVVIYARVSTDEQSAENQTPVLAKWATARGYTVVEVYSESASAWKDGHQKELARLVNDSHRRKFDVVIVWALDRLSRQGALAVLQLVNKLSINGVKVLSYQEPWTEVSGELSSLLYALTAWVAEMESKRRSERTIAGLQRRKAAGVKLGRPVGSLDKKKRREKTSGRRQA